MNLNDKELLDYSGEHFFYEVQMLLEVRKLLLSGISLEWTHRMAVIESFVIHLRNLITFLYPTTNIKATDIYAKHFFSDPDVWETTIKPKLSGTLEKARERAHKEVGHLTTERIAGVHDPRKQWLIKELGEEIIPILKSFCASADRNRLNNNVSTLLI